MIDMERRVENQREMGNGLLDRETSDSFVAEQLGSGLEALRHVVDEGINIMTKLSTTGYVFDDVGRVVVAHLFTHFLSALDGAELMLSHGAGYAAKTSLRAMVETCGFIAWILKDDTEFRAKCYIVGYRRGFLQFAQDHADENEQEFHDSINSAREALGNDSYREVNEAFAVARDKRGREPNWYTVAGKAGYMRQLLREADLPDVLQYFWSRYSAFSHGETMDDRVLLGDAELTIPPIRDIESTPDDVLTAAMTAYVVYRKICRHVLPKHEVHLVHRFRRWMKTIREMPAVSLRDSGTSRDA